MRSIAIYVEGGGQGKSGRAALRQGFDAFLDKQKQAARSRRWRWKLACVGSRNDAFKAFRNATRKGDADTVVLLVDAEGPLRDGPLAHLRERDGWNIDFADERTVHLMVQTMEAWIAADRDALSDYYGQRFHGSALPNSADLESVPKHDIKQSLINATRQTTKGEYRKIRHASALLAQISPCRVQERCDGCRRFLEYLDLILA